MKLGMECIQCLYFYCKHKILLFMIFKNRLQTPDFLKRKEPYLDWLSF